MNYSPGVLVDVCWLRHGYPYRFELDAPTPIAGPATVKLKLVSNESELTGVLREEVALLSRIAGLAERGSVRLFRSDAATLESLEHPQVSQPGTPGHIFRRVQFTKIKCGFDPVVEIRGRNLPPVPCPEDQLKSCFASHPDEELRELVTRFGRSHLVDVVHLLTANRNGLDFFLCDTAFLKTYANYLRTEKRKCLRTRAVTPSALLRLLGMGATQSREESPSAPA